MSCASPQAPRRPAQAIAMVYSSSEAVFLRGYQGEPLVSHYLSNTTCLTQVFSGATLRDAFGDGGIITGIRHKIQRDDCLDVLIGLSDGNAESLNKETCPKDQKDRTWEMMLLSRILPKRILCNSKLNKSCGF